jgi:selT/selW/selH-like putative selenoprotein
VSLAEEIEAKTGSQPITTPGGTGQFDVVRDGEMVFSKQAEGRFPEHDEILAQLT